MSSLDTTTGPTGLREPANALDERVVGLWTIQALMAVVTASVVLAIIVGVVALRAGGLWQLLWLVPAVLLAGGIVASVLVPRFLYRFYRWEVVELGLFVRQGWLFRRWSIVPHSRIQTVDSSSGPLQRGLGLATVEVRTAAGEGVAIPGLSSELVARLTEELAARTGRGEGT
jgi:membrane protein YdbS with pleckstrin-like domain